MDKMLKELEEMSSKEVHLCFVNARNWMNKNRRAMFDCIINEYNDEVNYWNDELYWYSFENFEQIYFLTNR